MIVTSGTNTYVKTTNADAFLSTIAGSTGAIILGNSSHVPAVDLSSGNLSIVANGATQSGPITANNLTISTSAAPSGSAIHLDNIGNTLVGTVSIAARGRSSDGSPYVTFTNSRQTLLGNITTTSNTSGDTGPKGAAKFTTTVGDLNLNGAIDVSGLTLVAARNIIQPAANSINSVTVVDTTQAGSTGLTLTAAGSITLAGTNTIQQTIASTGVGNATAVTSVGLLRFNTSAAGDVNLKLASNLQLQASNVFNGALTLSTTGTYTVNDTGGNPVTKTNSIKINAPLSASGLITLTAAGDIFQNTSAALDVHVSSATGLSATASGGGITLDDSGHTGAPVDVGNKVSGVVNLNAAGSATFYNTVKTVTGAAPGAAGPAMSTVTGLTIQVFDTVGVGGHNDLVLNNPITTSNTMSLTASGNIINYQGHSSLTAPNFSLSSGFGTLGATDGIGTFALSLASTSAGATVGFRALAPNGNVFLATQGSGQIGFGSGISASLQAGGTATVVVNGGVAQSAVSLTQLSGVIGTVQAGALSVQTVNSPAGSILLNNAANAVSAATLLSTNITLLNTGPLTLTSVRGGAGGSTNATSVYVQTSGILTLGDNSNASPVLATGQVFLRGASIFAAPGSSAIPSIAAATVGLVADTGTIGAGANFVISANNLAAKTTNQPITLGATVYNTLPLNVTSITFTNPSQTLNGISAGTGNVALLGAAALTINAGSIVSNNLRMTGRGITVTNAQINSLTAVVGTGGLTLTDPGSINISDPSALVGINSAGPLSLTALAGSITQISGAGGTVTAPIATLTAASTGNGVALQFASNAIGTISTTTNAFVSLFNTGDLTVAAATGINTGNVFIQSTGNITVASSSSGPTIQTTAFGFLRAGGSIFGGTGTAFQAPQLVLISDTGTIGTAAQPFGIATNSLSASTTNKNINLGATALNSLPLTIATLPTGAGGLIAATTTTGINAGGGNVQLLGGTTVAIQSAAASAGTIVANNLRITGGTVSVTSVINSLSANTSGAFTISNAGNLQINNLGVGAGIQSTGAVSLSLSTLGNISQVSGIAGTIVAGGTLFAGVNISGSNINLTNGLNAVTGVVTLNAPGNITFFNSVSTNIFRANYIPAQSALPAQLIDIEVFGAGNTLTVGSGVNQNGTSIYGSTITLHASGDIIQSGAGGKVSAIGISLISDAGNIGSLSLPLSVNAANLAARTNNHDMYITAFTGPVVADALVLGVVANLAPGGGFLSGLSAGAGNIQIFADSQDLAGPNTITANNLKISGRSIQLDDVVINSLAARTASGPIEISSAAGFQLNNLNSQPAILTTGDVSLSASVGSTTQAPGASGAITAGSLSSFATGGNVYDNPANAITGGIQIGSLGNATLVNSLATHLSLAFVGGTLTVQSGGDLELVAGPTIAALSAASASNGTSFKSNGTGTGNTGNGGIKVNGTTVVSAAILSAFNGTIVSLGTSGNGIVLSTPGKFINNAGATALLLPGGARFLVYSADPAGDVFGSLKTLNTGIFGTSYPTAITATGSRYVFTVVSSANTDYLGGAALLTNSATAPIVVGFVNALQPPPVNSPLTSILGNSQTAANAPPLVVGALPPPPPPPPPRNSPLADLSGPNGQSSEPPSSSDQATGQVANSLEGGLPPAASTAGGGVLIPGFLRATFPPPPGTLSDPSVLSGFGNSSLWQ